MRWRVLTAYSILLTAGAARGTEEDLGLLGRLARVASPEFGRLDDRWRELRRAPPEFHPPLTRGPSLGYHSAQAPSADSPRWVQVDLGESRPLDAVAVIPAAGPTRQDGSGYFFPLRFRVELADAPNLSDAVLVSDQSAADTPNPGNRPVVVPCGGRKGRYVRFTATRLAGGDGVYFFALSELFALSGELNLAAGRPATASDSIEQGRIWGLQNLTDGLSAIGPPLGPDPSPTNGYQSLVAAAVQTTKWVQIDLGEPLPLDEVRLIPARPSDYPDFSGYGFPVYWEVAAADDPGFDRPRVIARRPSLSSPFHTNPGDGPVVIPARGTSGRYVRLTVSRLWERNNMFYFALAEMQVYGRGRNVSRGRPVAASDSDESQRWGTKDLVDGYASQYRLLEWPEWLAAQTAREARDHELRQVEAAREAARGRVSDAVVYGAAGAGGLALLGVAAAWRRAGVVRRREVNRLRDRISRDLHDEVGSNIGSIILLAQAAAAGDGEAARRDAAEVAKVARQTADAMRDLVWLTRSGPDTSIDLLARLRETAGALLAGVEYTFDAPDDCLPRRVGLEFRRQVFLAFKETLHNVARHAQAKHVSINCRREGRKFCLEVLDDGKGFDPEARRAGTGLRGVEARAKALRGAVRVESQPGAGTTVRFTAPFG